MNAAARAAATTTAMTATSSTTGTSTTSSSPTSSPRSSDDDQLQLLGEDGFDLDRRPCSFESDVPYGGADGSCATSDSYDSAGEHDSHRHRLSVGDGFVHGGTATANNGGGHGNGTDPSDNNSWYSSSRVSSRAASPTPYYYSHTPETFWGDSHATNTPFGYRSVSRNRSRNASGANTPIHDKEHTGSDYYHSHHYQTSALLRKLGGTLTPDNSPVLGHKKRRPGWWSRRAESRRKHAGSPTESVPPGGSSAGLLGTPSTAKTRRDRSCWSTFTAALLRQPWVPTQPLTILFAFLLFGCFAATLTTFLVHVLSSDKQPLFWRQHCQEQRPFPHELADSLKPVTVFVGVFSVARQAERRNDIRLTWAKHTKPVDPRTGRPTQDIQVKFILGRPDKSIAHRVALEMEMYNDIVVLDINENMNHGKTYEYFKWAADNATVPVYYAQSGAPTASSRQVAVGFKKADYVVKADEDSFIVLEELERHLRITPREKTYWGYLVRNLFMAGEVYALSSDLVDYIATYKPLRQYTIGKEDQRVAKWMRIHPEYSTIHWVSERCWIYDHPKAGTTYSHGFLFPDEVERVKLEGRHGISEEERQRRGGELAPSYSTVSTWKKDYEVPAADLTIEEQVEALVEGGGRWTSAQGFRSDNGRGPEALRRDSVVFDRMDGRLVDSRGGQAQGGLVPDKDATGVKPGVPDRSVQIPSARTTRFGKDLFRDPDGVEAVQQLRKRDVEAETEAEDDGSRIIEIHNAVKAPWEVYERPVIVNPSVSAAGAEIVDSEQPASSNDIESSSSSPSTSASDASSATSPTAESSSAPENLPTGSIKVPQHNYILPPSESDRFLPPPTHRYDTSALSARDARMLGRRYGGTVAVHYLKRHEWFHETALALLGRAKTWDHGMDAPAFAPEWSSAAASSALEHGIDDLADVSVARVPTWEGQGNVQMVDAYWGGARMYGSPIVREDGYVSEGRPAESRREVVQTGRGGVPNTAGMSGRFGRPRTTPFLGLALEDGVEASVGGQVAEVSAKEELSDEALPAQGIRIQSAAA